MKRKSKKKVTAYGRKWKGARYMYKPHANQKGEASKFLASMKEIVKICNQAPNADIFISLMPTAEFFIYSK